LKGEEQKHLSPLQRKKETISLLFRRRNTTVSSRGRKTTIPLPLRERKTTVSLPFRGRGRVGVGFAVKILFWKGML